MLDGRGLEINLAVLAPTLGGNYSLHGKEIAAHFGKADNLAPISAPATTADKVGISHAACDSLNGAQIQSHVGNLNPTSAINGSEAFDTVMCPGGEDDPIEQPEVLKRQRTVILSSNDSVSMDSSGVSISTSAGSIRRASRPQ
ncbi:hypothetical protein V6N11_031193 [Hibiscus sabdariffa]|uniref:Uncharacterized protein n=2 Tax=Hibiscus sabdariffa TaxID=183260 RepID=A0ABR2B3A0_9ROSI